MVHQAVKIRFKGRDGGWQDKEWLYFAGPEIAVGDIVRVKTKWGEAHALVSEAGIDPKTIAPEICEKMRMIIGKEEATSDE